MLRQDALLHQIVDRWFERFPFRELSDHIAPSDAADRERLVAAFCRVFHAPDARQAKNIVFIWAVDRPFQHERGHQFASTVSYIEMTKGSLTGRWPKAYFRRITRDKPVGETPFAPDSLQQLADRDRNWSFYSRLIREHGPLRVWYASLDDLNGAALDAETNALSTVREWERRLIKSYRRLHGCRPLKNRRD